MRVRGIIFTTVTVSFILVLGAFQRPVRAPQEILTEEQYAAAMKEIDLTMGDAAMNIDAMYWDDLGVVTDRMTMLFERVQAFWTARQVQPAVDFSAAALAAIYAVGQASGAGSGPRANQTMTDLRSICESCHAEFREPIDGGFRIKQGT
jgi:hypothetical protein